MRRTPRIVEIDIAIDGLPAAFDGYRIGQISDVHCGSLAPKRRIDRWVASLNAATPDLIAVTGDLISSGDRFIDEVAASLGGLSAPDGVFACMGNHIARLISPFTHGLHSRGASQLYVSRGAGTSGPPVRMFAPAELTILTLRTAAAA